MKLGDYLDERLTWVIDSPGSRDALLKDLCDRICQVVAPADAERLYAALLEREAQGSTATPEGVALPHAMLEGVDRSRVAAALVPGGVDFSGEDAPKSKVDLIFLLIGPSDGAWEHLRILARLARICHATDALHHLRAASDAADLYHRLLEEDERHV